ncbi:MAG: 6,7-dimethyl-8-ribityllumazine synthase [Gemmatimonadota bacterium]
MSTAGSSVDERRGEVDGTGRRVALIVARFNHHVTDRLRSGAHDALLEHGVAAGDVSTIWVPGAWELPQTAQQAVRSGGFDAVITLGCVIRGETPHFDYVCQEASLGLGAVARDAGIPVVFGVLTTDDEPQAMARAADGKDNKGYETAMAALEMISVYASLEATGR